MLRLVQSHIWARHCILVRVSFREAPACREFVVDTVVEYVVLSTTWTDVRGVSMALSPHHLYK
jgi:hypothetical protein